METREREAFVKSYLRSCGSATENELNEFLDFYLSNEDENIVYEKYPWIYASISDALAIWNDARKFDSE